MEYKILQPKTRSVLLKKGVTLDKKYSKITELQPVIKGQQTGMMHPIQNRYDSKTKILFY